MSTSLNQHNRTILEDIRQELAEVLDEEGRTSELARAVAFDDIHISLGKREYVVFAEGADRFFSGELTPEDLADKLQEEGLI